MYMHLHSVFAYTVIYVSIHVHVFVHICTFGICCIQYMCTFVSSSCYYMQLYITCMYTQRL